jgi:alanyl-tRNA synthetase
MRELLGHDPESFEHERFSYQVIADHSRAVTFLAADGVIPSNEGRGYVLRRILRRAVRHGRLLGRREPFLGETAKVVIDTMHDAYPHLAERRAEILGVIEREERQFNRTLEAGVGLLEEALIALTSEDRVVGRQADHLPPDAPVLPGGIAFRLHDTFGFPIDLTQEIAAARGVSVDIAAFEVEMSQQRTRARAASRFEKTGGGTKRAWTKLTEGPDSAFTGYDATSTEGASIRAWREAGEELELLLDRTPAYAESGGQVADQGMITAGGTRAVLTHVYKEDDAIVHRVNMAAGSRDDLLGFGAKGHCTVRVDPVARSSTQRHHTATHLLHAALRTVLGDHVHQAGSLVAPDRLRFDYSHFEAPSPLQGALVEQRVNDWVLANVDVGWQEMPLAAAKTLGAMALFGEKYGERVRVVTVNGVPEADIEPSRELCGGTHVRRTGDIGLFAITEETAVASGVRRIEALCGPAARTWFMEQRGTLESVLGVLQAPRDKVLEVAQRWRDELGTLRKASAQASKQGLEAEFAQLAAAATQAPGGRWVVAKLRSAGDANAVRDAADKLRGALRRGAAVLALETDGKLTFVAVVTDDLISENKLRADELVRSVAKVAGGSGGGKPHLALAGGRDLDKLDAALAEAQRLLSGALA